MMTDDEYIGECIKVDGWAIDGYNDDPRNALAAHRGLADENSGKHMVTSYVSIH